jgi:AraC-like DNA-binding protein
MTETLFAFDEENYQQCQHAYRGEKDQEYYLGDYRIEAGAHIEVRAEKKTVGASSIICLHSKNRLFFQRSWTHIREDATDVTVLWFVNNGSLEVTHSGGSIRAGAGDFAVTRSMKPFSIECTPDADAPLEVLHVIIPSHLLRRVLPTELKAASLVSAGNRALGLAQGIFAGLYADGDAVTDSNQQALLDSALAITAEAIGQREECMQVRVSLREERLREVLRYIDVHLCDPSLSASMVASGCGISPRYLSALLKENGTPFSELVWGQRVKAAGRWLETSTPADVSIAEIAFRVGFKSPAHFSRMFKRVYRQGPREYRNACQAGVAADNTPPPAQSRGALYLASNEGEVSNADRSRAAPRTHA